MRVDATVNGVNAAGSARPFGGTDDFMALLVAQLQAQDPLSPMDPSELLGQLAQLQSVAQLHTISGLLADDGGSAIRDAVAMIGRTVRCVDPETGEVIEAPVERVNISDGACWLVLGDHELSLQDVLSVGS